ncbi:MAG: DUF1761 domain-containing protein [Caulobacterales bacterium]|jgi:hypothetical protein
MRINGVNVIAVLVAALAMYAVGFVVYGLAFSDLWMGLSGFTDEMLAPHAWKFALSPIMPALGAIGIALAMKWRGATGVAGGLSTGALVWLFLTFSSRLYSYVYGPEPVGLLALDSAHLLATHLVAGAILGAMK